MKIHWVLYSWFVNIFDLLHKKFILKSPFFYVTRDYSKWAVRGLSITLPSLFVASLCCLQKVKNRASEKKSLLPMYEVPLAAVTNYHKLGGLKWQKYIVSQFLRPEDWNQYHWEEIKVSSGSCFLQRLQGVIPYLFQFLVTVGIPWLVAISL